VQLECDTLAGVLALAPARDRVIGPSASVVSVLPKALGVASAWQREGPRQAEKPAITVMARSGL